MCMTVVHIGTFFPGNLPEGDIHNCVHTNIGKHISDYLHGQYTIYDAVYIYISM